MTDHLPECPWPEKPCGPSHEPMHDRQPLFCVACLTECDCDRLRACEQRVRDEIAADGPWFRSVVHQCCEDKQTAYAAGLDAAREAVKHLQHSDDCYYAEGVLCHCEIKSALAAIDALRLPAEP